MNPLPVSAVALLASLLVGAACACVALACTRRIPRDRQADPRTPPLEAQRLAVGAAAAFVVLLATRWPVLALVSGALAVAWPRLLRDDRATQERRHLEGIAKWLEDLRDTLRGSSLGAEEALERAATSPPAVLREPMSRFVFRRRQGVRTEDALVLLGDDLAHPTADAALAAIRLVVGGSAGAARLHRTTEALARAARDELAARERIDRTRAVHRGSMRRLVVIGAVMIAYLRIGAGDLLEPYGTVGGQLFLLLPLSMWAGCVMWLRRLCRDDAAPRSRLAPAGGAG